MASLDQLPLDLQFSIFSYLVCPLISYDFPQVPQSHEELTRTDIVAHKKAADKPLSNHPFLALAAQCRSLRFSIETFCHHLLRKRLTVSEFKIFDPSYREWSANVISKGRKAELRTYRLQYVKFTFQHCLFCGKKSKRRAVFNSHMWCCLKCDNKEFGEKISKSVALSQYHVKSAQCQYPHIMFPGSGLKPLEMAFANLAVYKGATMLFRKDIEALSIYIKANDPKGIQYRILKKRLVEKDILDQHLRSLRLEREARQILTEALDQPMPQDEEGRKRLQREFEKGKDKLRDAFPIYQLTVTQQQRFLRLVNSLIACSANSFRRVYVQRKGWEEIYRIESLNAPEPPEPKYPVSHWGYIHPV